MSHATTLAADRPWSKTWFPARHRSSQDGDLNNPQGLQEFVCLEQMKEMPLLEIHRANQKLHEQLAQANERVKELEAQVEFKIKECMELAQSCHRYKNICEQLRKEQEK